MAEISKARLARTIEVIENSGPLVSFLSDSVVGLTVLAALRLAASVPSPEPGNAKLREALRKAASNLSDCAKIVRLANMPGTAANIDKSAAEALAVIDAADAISSTRHSEKGDGR